MSDQAARLRITSLGEVADLVPYLVGFQPEESLVILVVQDGRTAVTARVDLADITAPGQAELLLDRLWGRFPDAAGVTLAYTSDHLTGWNLIHRCSRHQPASTRIASLLIDGQVWHTPDGLTGELDPYSHLAVEATYHGMARRDSRADLEASLASRPDTPELTARLHEATATLPDTHDTAALAARTRQLLDAALTTGPLDQADALRLAALVHHPVARDTALLTMTVDTAEQHYRVWQGVVTQTPASASAPALFLAGMASWASGNGAAANIAHDKLIDVEPFDDHSVAAILRGLSETVTPPQAWRQLRNLGLASTTPDIRQAATGTTPPWETVTPPPPGTRPVDPPPTNPSPGPSLGL